MAFKDIAHTLWDDTLTSQEPTFTRDEKARSALYAISAANQDYDTWKNTAIAFKAAGGLLTDWLEWCAIDATRYDEKAATRLFDSVDPEGAITEDTLWKYAWDAGWNWREKRQTTDEQTVFKTMPTQRTFESADEQATTQLKAMFRENEFVNIVTDAKWLPDKEKWVPTGYGKQYRCEDLCDSIERNGLEAAIGGYNHDAGVWLRVNPMDGRGISDENVKSCRYALVESDDMALKDQERVLFEMNLPIVCITNSGGKSLHAIVRIDADGRNHYRDRVLFLHRECKSAGLSIDSANKNPSRLTRLAGVVRGEREQTLMHTRIGAKDFPTWVAHKQEAKIVYDSDIEPMDMHTPPVLDEVLIDGLMRRGDKMCVAGASKSYKSFSLVQLAVAMACGSEWFGWQCKQGRVLYINCEIRKESFRERVINVAKTMNADVSSLEKNLDIWSRRGTTEPLNSQAAVERLISKCKAYDYDLVIFDPIYKVFDGDENNAQDVSAFMMRLDEIALKLHTSIAYCHHHSKGFKGDVAAQDRFSGSGVFARDCDELVDISRLDLNGQDPTEWGFKPDATAWRIETVIRDFAPKPYINVMFDYPVHTVDETGYLDDLKVMTPQSIAGRKRGEQKREEMNENVSKLEDYCLEHFKYEPQMRVKELADVFGCEAKTIINRANKAEKLRVVKVGNANFIEEK